MLRERFKIRTYLLTSLILFCTITKAQESVNVPFEGAETPSPTEFNTSPIHARCLPLDNGIVASSSIINIVQPAPRYSNVKPLSQATVVPSCAALPTVAQPIFVSVPTKPDDFWRPATLLPIILSVFSFLLAGGNILYTVWKDRRARRHSVVDDYWFRKVVGPMTVEPMLSSIQELMANIPEDKSSARFKLHKVKTFHDNWVKKLSNIAAETNSLDMLEQGLGQKVAEKIDEIQDLVIEYWGNQQPKSVGQQKSEFRNSVNSCWRQIMAVIKEAQTKLK